MAPAQNLLLFKPNDRKREAGQPLNHQSFQNGHPQLQENPSISARGEVHGKTRSSDAHHRRFIGHCTA